MLAQRPLGRRPSPSPHRLKMGDGSAASDDRELLASLDGIQQVRELPRCLGRAHIGHIDQIIGFFQP
jgi:hypothetical protein